MELGKGSRVFELTFVLTIFICLTIILLRGLITDSHILAGGGTATPPTFSNYLKYYIPYTMNPSSLGVEYLTPVTPSIGIWILSYLLVAGNNLYVPTILAFVAVIASFMCSFISFRYVLNLKFALSVVLSLLYGFNPALSIMISHLDLTTALAYAMMPLFQSIIVRALQSEINLKIVLIIVFLVLTITGIYPNTALLEVVASLILLMTGLTKFLMYRERRYITNAITIATIVVLTIIIYHIPILIEQQGYISQHWLASYEDILEFMNREYCSWNPLLFMRFISDTICYHNSPLVPNTPISLSYLSLIAFLITLSLVRRRNWSDNFFVYSVLVFTIVLTFCYLVHTRILAWLLPQLPIVGYIRQPRTWFILFNFAYLYIVGRGIEGLTFLVKTRTRKLLLITLIAVIMTHSLYMLPVVRDGVYGTSYIRGNAVFIPSSILKIPDMIPNILNKSSIERALIVPNGVTPISAATKHVINVIDYLGGDTPLDEYVRQTYKTVLLNPDAAALLSLPLRGKYLVVIKDSPYDTSKKAMGKSYFIVDPEEVENLLKDSSNWKLIYKDYSMSIYENRLLPTNEVEGFNKVVLHFGTSYAERILAQYFARAHISKELVYIYYRIPHILTDGLSKGEVLTLLNIAVNSSEDSKNVLVILSEPMPYYRDGRVNVYQDPISKRVSITVKGVSEPGFIVIKVRLYSNSTIELLRGKGILWKTMLPKGEIVLPIYINSASSIDLADIHLELVGNVRVRGAIYITVSELSRFVSMLEEMKKCGLLEVTSVCKGFITKIEKINPPGGKLYASLFKKLYNPNPNLGRTLEQFLSNAKFFNVAVINSWPYTIAFNSSERFLAVSMPWRMFHYPKVDVRGSAGSIIIPSFGGLTTLIVVNPSGHHIEVRLELFDAFRNAIMKFIPMFYLAIIFGCLCLCLIAPRTNLTNILCRNIQRSIKR